LRITDNAEQPILNNVLRIQLSLPMIPHVIAEVSSPLIFYNWRRWKPAYRCLLRFLSRSRFNNDPWLNSDAIGPCLP
jgi:hypothetical protein